MQKPEALQCVGISEKGSKANKSIPQETLDNRLTIACNQQQNTQSEYLQYNWRQS